MAFTAVKQELKFTKISYRYVANIIGKNSILIMIPCHRVIYSSGKIGGYKKGVALKRKLLNLENIDI